MTIKRSTSVTVKMTEEDYALLERAANSIWPRAVLTKSSIVLGLAKIAAEDALSKQPRRGEKRG
jgi:uncharacterized protein (DUF1778 family)